MASSKPKQWDVALPQAEFAYNRSQSRTIGFSPFEVVYGRNPPGVLDLAPVPRVAKPLPKAKEMADHLQSIHEQVQKRIQASNAQYKKQHDQHRHIVVFEVEDLAWATLTKDRFPVREYHKLRERKNWPCEILQRIDDNAYRLRLPSHIRTSDAFNV